MLLWDEMRWNQDEITSSWDEISLSWNEMRQNQNEITFSWDKISLSWDEMKQNQNESFFLWDETKKISWDEMRAFNLMSSQNQNQNETKSWWNESSHFDFTISLLTAEWWLQITHWIQKRLSFNVNVKLFTHIVKNTKRQEFKNSILWNFILSRIILKHFFDFNYNWIWLERNDWQNRCVWSFLTKQSLS